MSASISPVRNLLPPPKEIIPWRTDSGARSAPGLSPSTPDLSPSTPDLSRSAPDLSQSAPDSTEDPRLSPTPEQLRAREAREGLRGFLVDSARKVIGSVVGLLENANYSTDNLPETRPADINVQITGKFRGDVIVDGVTGVFLGTFNGTLSGKANEETLSGTVNGSVYDSKIERVLCRDVRGAVRGSVGVPSSALWPSAQACILSVLPDNSR